MRYCKEMNLNRLSMIVYMFLNARSREKKTQTQCAKQKHIAS